MSFTNINFSFSDHLTKEAISVQLFNTICDAIALDLEIQRLWHILYIIKDLSFLRTNPTSLP